MKVVEVRVYCVSISRRHPVLAEVVTDEGVGGVGEAAIAYGTGALAAAGMVKELAERFVLGQDPFRIEALWSEMYDRSFWAKGGGPVVFAGISALEQALWDIKGKRLGVPVYEMLGGRCRETVRVYANGWSLQCAKPADFAREAERVVGDGYTALKFYPLAMPELTRGPMRHASRRSLDREEERRAVSIVKAVREAVGSEVDILLDMGGELTPAAAIRVGRRFEEWDIFFLEEPVDPFDVEALKKVSDHVHIPLAVGERLYTRYGFRRVLELHAADVLQPDIGITGGILEAKKIAAMAEAYSMHVQPHNAASPVSTAAALQLDACIPNFLIQEVVPYRIRDHYAIVDHAPELTVANGEMPIPDRPGLGVTLVEERVRPFLWTTCTL